MNLDHDKETSEVSSIEKKSSVEVPILLASVFIIAVCGILYELLISSISTYFLGSSILHFSITIGLFLSAMGVGSFLSRYAYKNLMDWFISIEIVLGFIGGISALLLNFTYAVTESYYAVVFLLIVVLGGLIGLEIPLVTRILKGYDELKETISNVLAFDYLGSLVASVAFPLLLLPYLGTMRTSFFIGILNICIAIFNTQIFRSKLKNPRSLYFWGGLSLLSLGIGMAYSFTISSIFEQMIYEDDIQLSKQSKYQKIVLTHHNKNTRLYLNGNLQFSSVDEYRYHEALVHVPMSLPTHVERVLLLGAGDGLAVRELLKYPQIQEIDLVDLDQEVTRIARMNPLLTQLNENSLENPKVKVHHMDAFKFVENCSTIYNVILIDLPDPHDADLSKLYTKEFYGMIHKILAADGVVVSQSTSPYFAPKAFWCIEKSMQEVFPTVIPYHAYIPSFGPWGFNLAQKFSYPVNDSIPAYDTPWFIRMEERIIAKEKQLGLRFLSEDMLPALFLFEKDYLSRDSLEVNKLDNHRLVQYYESSWKQWE